jgi:O-acetyl-ADP-ribose deacetylase (regulator of RNase III)
MGSGIAKQIKEKWPIAYTEFVHFSIKCFQNKETALGQIQIIPAYKNDPDPKSIRKVINMFAQDRYGYDGRRYTSYDAFDDCLDKISKSIPAGSTIGFPDHIGCGLGGADWDIIKAMIKNRLSDKFKVYIYKKGE